jgi:hypothetical protein
MTLTPTRTKPKIQNQENQEKSKNPKPRKNTKPKPRKNGKTKTKYFGLSIASLMKKGLGEPSPKIEGPFCTSYNGRGPSFLLS